MGAGRTHLWNNICIYYCWLLGALNHGPWTIWENSLRKRKTLWKFGKRKWDTYRVATVSIHVVHHVYRVATAAQSPDWFVFALWLPQTDSTPCCSWFSVCRAWFTIYLNVSKLFSMYFCVSSRQLSSYSVLFLVFILLLCRRTTERLSEFLFFLSKPHEFDNNWLKLSLDIGKKITSFVSVVVSAFYRRRKKKSVINDPRVLINGYCVFLKLKLKTRKKS